MIDNSVPTDWNRSGPRSLGFEASARSTRRHFTFLLRGNNAGSLVVLPECVQSLSSGSSNSISLRRLTVRGAFFTRRMSCVISSALAKRFQH